MHHLEMKCEHFYTEWCIAGYGTCHYSDVIIGTVACVPKYQPHGCLLNRLFRRKSNKLSKLRVTGLCEGDSPVTGEIPAQRVSYAINVSIWWRLHVYCGICDVGEFRMQHFLLQDVSYCLRRKVPDTYMHGCGFQQLSSFKIRFVWIKASLCIRYSVLFTRKANIKNNVGK